MKITKHRITTNGEKFRVEVQYAHVPMWVWIREGKVLEGKVKLFDNKEEAEKWIEQRIKTQDWEPVQEENK